MITVTITPTHLGKARKRINRLMKEKGRGLNCNEQYANCVVAVATGEKVKKGVRRCGGISVTYNDNRTYVFAKQYQSVLWDLICKFDMRNDAGALTMLPMTVMMEKQKG